MIAAHFENLIFLLLIAVALLFQLLASAASKTNKDQKKRTSTPMPRTPPPIGRPPTESDEERIRKFLEALGQPTGSRPPPPVVPRTNIPPRPLAPIRPPPIPIAPNVFTGRKRPVVEARKTPSAPVFEVYETAAPQPPAPTPAAAYAVATRPDLVGREAKVDIVTLLRSQSGLRNAIVLREIFGAPRSLQRLDLVQSLELL
jgi:hypothetical protein